MADQSHSKKSLAALLLIFCFIPCANAQDSIFEADKTSGCFPVTVQFNDISSMPNATAWTWSFGNGNTSHLQNPKAVYTEAGSYTVSLTIFNGNTQIASEVKAGYIVVHAYPEIDFSFDETSGCSPLTVQFTNDVNQSSGAISSWQWIFGDGGTSTLANPEYMYELPGIHSVSLKVVNEFGCESTETLPSAIEVFGPNVQFTPSATTLCQVPSLIQFTNSTTGTGTLTHHWNFGDGQTSTAPNPSHSFVDVGVFTVRLTTTDGQGCVSFKETQIHTGTEGGLDFQPSFTQLCKGQPLSFTVQSTHPIVSQSWSFDNGTTSTAPSPVITYQDDGTYNITLSAQLQGKGCQSVVTKRVQVIEDPTPAFNTTLSCNNTLTATNTSKGAQRVEWSVSNVVISTAQTLVYNPPLGNFEITLTAYNALNCAKVLKKTIPIPTPAAAAFSPIREQDCVEPSLSVCAPAQINFQNLSTSGSMPIAYSWSLGGGLTSTDANPQRNFGQNETGDFVIGLVITDARGCKDSLKATVHVANENPVAKFIVDKNEVCVGEQVRFTDQSENANFLCWDMGNGSIVTGKDPIIAYYKPGEYQVGLTAKNAGCTHQEATTTLIKVKDPFVDFEVVKSCGDPYLVQFNDRSEKTDEISWDFGDGTTVSDVASLDHRFMATGTYEVTLTGTNDETHCVVPIKKSIIIQDIKADFALTNDTPCKNDPTISIDHSEFAVGWYWYVDNQLFATTRTPTFTFATSGNHEIRQLVSDSDGCTDTKSMNINVPDITGNFSFEAASTCDEFTVAFTDQSIGSPPIDSWHWEFGDGASSDLQHVTHVYDRHDSFDITLHLTNAEGNCTFVHHDAVVFSIPLINFTSPKTNFCPNETAIFSNNTLNANEFSWEFGNGGKSSLLSPSTFYSEPGTYDVTLEATDRFGCTLALTKQAFVQVTQPTASFDALQTSAECPPLTSIFNNKSVGSNLTYFWTFGNGATSTLSDAAYTYTRPGVYDVGLTVRDQFGCTHSTTSDDLIEVGGPDGNFEVQVSDMCINAQTTMAAEATNTVSYQWDFGDGNVINMSEPDIDHTYRSAGAFHPSLVLIDEKNCHVVAEGGGTISVHDSTAVEFTFSPACIFNGEPFYFTATNQNNDAHEWLINDQKVAEGIEHTFAIDSAGTYLLELRGTNEFGCISKHQQAVKIHGTIDNIPNVFTPNGDSFNEFFVIPGVEDSDWTLKIFNRWGKEVFSQQNYQNDWRGDSVGAGTYFYSLNNQTCADRSYKGYIHVLK